jgi:RNA-directed DNA polymerase
MGEEFSKAVLAFQSRLANYASRVKEHRFHALYDLLCRREWLEEALNAVLDNNGSITAGVDGVTKRGFSDTEGKKRAKFLDDLQKELKSRDYHPFPVLRKWIPKRKKGGQRPIGIPTLKDRVVQMLLKMVLEPIFECDFLSNSNGFRPNRSTLECILPLYKYGNTHNRYDYVIEGDIEGCFDNFDHEILMKSVQKRIGDKQILRLIWRFLKAPIKENKLLFKPKRGTPQGGILSPLLANIYLNEFDQYWLEHWGSVGAYQRSRQLKQGKATCVLFRYADDFILSAKGTRDQVERIMDEVNKFAAEQLKLNFSTDKTRIVSIDEGFKFLGFQIKRERLAGYKCVRVRPTQDNVTRCKIKLQMMLGKDADLDDPPTKIAALNRVLRGWALYYWKVNSLRQFLAIDYYARQLFLQWFARKQKISMTQALPIVVRNGKIIIEREGIKFQLFRMSELPSQHTTLSHKETWKYRHISNPYLKGELKTVSSIEPDDPLKAAEAIQNIQCVDASYGEIYLRNRIRALRRDGWRCRDCGMHPKQLVAHHVIPVPRKGGFDPTIVHRVDNLRTMCANCHRHLSRN